MLSSISHLIANAGLLADSTGAGGAAVAGGIGIFMILVWVFGVAVTILWIWMLIDCLSSSLPTNEKLLWAIVIILLPLVGSLLYMFIARPRGRGTPAIST